jgi:hypothetical protein
MELARAEETKPTDSLDLRRTHLQGVAAGVVV